MAIPVGVSLLHHFAALSDPRQPARVRYPLNNSRNRTGWNVNYPATLIRQTA